MKYRNIPLKEETFKRLMRLRHHLEEERGKRVSWDDVIKHLLAQDRDR